MEPSWTTLTRLTVGVKGTMLRAHFDNVSNEFSMNTTGDPGCALQLYSHSLPVCCDKGQGEARDEEAGHTNCQTSLVLGAGLEWDCVVFAIEKRKVRSVSLAPFIIAPRCCIVLTSLLRRNN